MPSLLSGLRRSRERLQPRLDAADADTVYKELERSLLTADAGTKATGEIIAAVRAAAGDKPDLAMLGTAIRKTIGALLDKLEKPAVVPTARPHVIMLVGTNGGGKTTTTAKLARQAIAKGQQVVLAAADTFRAAAAEQLGQLAQRLGDQARVVTGEEPGATAYNAVKAAEAGGADLAIIDTAGRQPTSKALMAEASKISRAIGKAMSGAPHETLLAIDANTGQNALRQVQIFGEAVAVDGIALTKLDSTARGGVILAIAASHDVPVRFVGVGEGVDDLLPFSASDFTTALFAEQESGSS